MSEKSRLNITDVRSIPLKVVRTIGEIQPAWDPRIWRQQVGGGSFVEVHADQGLTGMGPAVNTRLIGPVNEHLLGKDPFDIERHAHVLRYFAFIVFGTSFARNGEAVRQRQCLTSGNCA